MVLLTALYILRVAAGLEEEERVRWGGHETEETLRNSIFEVFDHPSFSVCYCF